MYTHVVDAQGKTLFDRDLPAFLDEDNHEPMLIP